LTKKVVGVFVRFSCRFKASRVHHPFGKVLSYFQTLTRKNNLSICKGWKKAYEKVTGHKVCICLFTLMKGYIDTDGKPQYNPHAHVIVNRMDSKTGCQLGQKAFAAVRDLTAGNPTDGARSTLAKTGERGRKACSTP
jgi:hypothetical protein